MKIDNAQQLTKELNKLKTMNEIFRFLQKQYDLDEELTYGQKAIVVAGLSRGIEIIEPLQKQK